MTKRLAKGPIAGENYTSDTKNYPWHRPAEFTDPDKAIEFAFKQLTIPKKAQGLLGMISMGLSVSQATDIFLTSGIGAGKWNVDLAIMLAGPVARMIELMAKSYGVSYSMGIDDNEDDYPPSSNFFKNFQSMSNSKVNETIETSLNELKQVKDEFIAKEGQPTEEVAKPEEEEKKPMTGFMARAGAK